MEVPITQFRRDIFDLAARALKGETISVTYKGERLRLVPELQPTTRFDRVTPMQVLSPDGGYDAAKAERQADFEKLWEKKWADL